MAVVRRIGWFAIYAGMLQIALILMFMGFVRYDTFYDGTKWNYTKHHGHETPNVQTYYPMFQDVHVMIVIGFGFLMTFLKKYGFSAVGVNLLLTAITIQLAIVVEGMAKARGDPITVNILSLLNADFACAAVLITYGAVLGKTSPTQMLLMSVVEVVMFVINFYLCVEVLGIVDLGGSIVVHTFGAYFGLAFSRTVSRKIQVGEHPQEGSSYVSDLFSMIGTLFLWVYWPSFNAVLGSDRGMGRAVINTYLGLVSAVVAAFIASAWVDKKNQWSMVHVQNATLSGGVAVGAVADQMIQPWGALVVGFIAGLLSTLGYIYIQPWLEHKIGLHDSCGVNNLHGMPGLFSALISIGTALFASETFYGKELYVQFPQLSPPANTTAYLELQALEGISIAPGAGRTPGQQALCQALATLITFVLSIISGALTGLLLSCSRRFEPLGRPQLYSDASWWDLPNEDDRVPIPNGSEDPPKMFNIPAPIPEVGGMKFN